MRHLLLGIAFGVAFAGNQPHAQTKALREISFCSDDPDTPSLKSPLPAAIINALMNTREGRRSRREARGQGRPLNESALFSGTRIRLADFPGTFFLVMGSPPMTGGDNTWYWLVQQKSARVAILLFAGGNCLTLEPTMTSGYRDIETDWSTPNYTQTVIYRWNGQSYKRLRTELRKLSPKDLSPHLY